MDEHETWIRQTIAGPWPLLWPLRARFADLLKRAAAELPAWTHGEARAAFGIEDPPPALAAALYRDLYRDPVPRAVTWAAAIGALRRGDPKPLDARVAQVDGAPDDWRRAWYEIVTLAGRVTIVPRTRLVGPTQEALIDATPRLDPPLIAGGAPEALLDAGTVALALHAELVEPFTLERHCKAIAASAVALEGGVLPGPVATAAALVLAHHADDATAARLFDNPVPPGAFEGRDLARSLALPADAAALADASRLALRSAVREKRWLAFHLLRIAGELPQGAHPDDQMPAPPGAPAGLYVS
jgi:hypothetical protein